ncbi:MAG: hypothetical protein ABI233_05280 [Chthoniobacterales bacterium]
MRAADTLKVIDVKVTGRGKPVILIPGLATPGAIRGDTVKHLLDKYECHAITIAGCGGMRRDAAGCGGENRQPAR